MHPIGPERPGVRDDADAGLLTARPPREFTVVASWPVHTVTDIAELRAELLRWITMTGATVPALALGDVANKMMLVASELATNAVRHGQPPTVVSLLRHADALILDVADHAASRVPVIAGPRAPGRGGFGLMIARRLAQEVAWYADPPAKHVWAMFAAHA